LIVNVNGTELFVARHGEGVPLLTFHGPGFDHTMLRPWLDPIGTTCELIYFDQRGCGRSRREDLSQATDLTWTTDAEALRESLGLEQVIVFGHSYGGCLAQEYALRYPDCVRGLILCSTAPAFDYPEAMMANALARATDEQFAMLQKAFSAPLSSDAELRQAWQATLPVYFHSYSPCAAEALGAELQFSAAALNRVILDLLPLFNTLDRLAKIEVPTLILTGTSDWVTPPDHAAGRLANLIRGASMVMFRESGHYPYVEEPERFLSAVDTWLTDVLTAGPPDAAQ
jgi:proline iminopeptidase